MNDEAAKPAEKRLSNEFFRQPVHELAMDFLGRRLVRKIPKTGAPQAVSGRIVEVEVYTGSDDPASHASDGSPTDRTEPMFARPGTIYVYRIYGMWDCLNIAAESTGEPAAILIRAAAPVTGLSYMADRRDVNPSDIADGDWPTSVRTKLLSGPGKLCQAMEITPSLDSEHVESAPIWLEAGDRAEDQPPTTVNIERTPRIGLNRETVGDATDWPWRYIDADSAFLSR